MPTYTVQMATTRLSSILEEVEAGQEAVIVRGQRPIARLVPAVSRRFGQLDFHVSDDFDAPLPDDELAAWE
ncbi:MULTISPECIES: type II toxin-antitoxin system Phd/YefM family antitoxin [unclassified Luteococcus]|uniref:type II toxin-antitoxin system Phd/YefM family antitoxin n=1 Tax=unclassified Luteococcus TaxID=2639923 RepID=UPI00313D8AF0